MMRKYFDHAYEGFSNSMLPLVDTIAEVAKILFVYATLPIWIVPYALFFRKENYQEQ